MSDHQVRAVWTARSPLRPDAVAERRSGDDEVAELPAVVERERPGYDLVTRIATSMDCAERFATNAIASRWASAA